MAAKEIAGARRQQPDIGSDGHAARTAIDRLAERRRVERERPCRLAAARDPAPRITDARDHLRMPGIAAVPERGREVGRPDEDAVDPVHRGDLLQGAKRSDRLELHQQADLVVGYVEIGGHFAPAGGAREAGRDPAPVVTLPTSLRVRASTGLCAPAADALPAARR